MQIAQSIMNLYAFAVMNQDYEKHIKFEYIRKFVSYE